MNIITSMGPASQHLQNDVIEGYHPASRNNEQIQNAFVDTLEWNALDTGRIVSGDGVNVVGAPAGLTDGQTGPFHEWATIMPGMITVSHKDRAVNFRNKMVAESAVPVIGCAQCKGPEDDDAWFFAGVCRSKTVRMFDDGHGPKTDEMFTVHIGGVVTLLNNGSDSIHPGDVCEWTFADSLGTTPFQRPKGLRRIQVRGIMSTNGTNSLRRAIGTAKSFAKRNEMFDVLVGSTTM